MDPELIALQERIAHQEAAIDELTRQSLQQEERVRALLRRVEQLEGQLRELAEQVGPQVEDAPPPHY
ncbi:MAG TPA: SlyX family protein [Gammaproteobacteria bacterium]|nr:SlyX family protein [Gammaproteobacteria bacterium]